MMFEVVIGKTSALRANRSGLSSEPSRSSVDSIRERSELTDRTRSYPASTTLSVVSDRH